MDSMVKVTKHHNIIPGTFMPDCMGCLEVNFGYSGYGKIFC